MQCHEHDRDRAGLLRWKALHYPARAARVPGSETVEWFASLGVRLHEEPSGKLFPNTNSSRDVLSALTRELADSGAALQPSTRVTAIAETRPNFSLETNRGPIAARRIVLATGGQSLPKTEATAPGSK